MVDLLLVQSNLYVVENGHLKLNEKRVFPELPVIKLGENFKTVSEYQSRFKTTPNILELDSLTVNGDVYFGSNVTLKGNVIIVAQPGHRIDIPDGSVLENKVVTGSIRIMDQ